ncbi:MAG: hypothetical protein CL534_08780 [Ahrensia sp.]|nr:hypothetical protein [Ahrensia sp.]
MLKRWLIEVLIKPLIRAEVPGWGRLYAKFIGSWQSNEFWKGSRPKIIIDKRCGYYRVANICEWADRSLYFLGRWYDLAASLAVESLLKDGQSVLDIGANYGHFTLAAAKAVGPNGNVVSFEPNPKAYARLLVHLDLNRLSWVTAKNAGLSDRAGRMKLSIPQVNSGEATFGLTRYEDVSTIDVPVYTVDEFLGDKKFDFIKIDVEGFEMHVLRGAKRIIERDRPLILTEVVGRHLESAGQNPGNLLQFFESLNYQGYRMGLRGVGAKQRLHLEENTGTIEQDGDYIWVCKSKKYYLEN